MGGVFEMKEFIYLVLIIVVTSMCAIGEDYFLEEKAKKLATQGYISEGCLYLIRKDLYKNSFENYTVGIDGKDYYFLDILIYDFPFYSKSYNFFKSIKKDIECYHIQYVEVDFLFYERRYIYNLM